MSRSHRLRAERRPSLARRVYAGWCVAARMARLAIGIPDYDTYVAHQRERHSDRPPMGREEFFRERMLARYGKGRPRCC